MHPVVGEIIGWEFLLVIAVIALLFGSTQIPKLARSLGSAKKEFEQASVSTSATPRRTRSRRDCLFIRRRRRGQRPDQAGAGGGLLEHQVDPGVHASRGVGARSAADRVCIGPPPERFEPPANAADRILEPALRASAGRLRIGC
jgi:sec-independent protein translocase protein TatA